MATQSTVPTTLHVKYDDAPICYEWGFHLDFVDNYRRAQQLKRADVDYWQIVRDSDGVVLAQWHSTTEKAEAWRRERVAALTQAAPVTTPTSASEFKVLIADQQGLRSKHEQRATKAFRVEVEDGSFSGLGYGDNAFEAYNNALLNYGENVNSAKRQALGGFRAEFERQALGYLVLADDAFAPDPSDAAEVTIERDDYVRMNLPGSYRPFWGFVESVQDGQVLISNRFGARWVTAEYVVVILKQAALETAAALSAEAEGAAH